MRLPPRLPFGADRLANNLPAEVDGFEKKGDLAGALAAVDRVLADNPNDAAALEHSAVLMTGLGTPDERCMSARLTGSRGSRASVRTSVPRLDHAAPTPGSSRP